MYLLARFIFTSDALLVPLCIIIFYAIIRYKANRQTERHVQKLYYQAFAFKVICAFFFTIIVEYYFKGGDTGLYYQATLDLRAAVKDDPGHFWTVLTTSKLNSEHPLSPYFFYDNYIDDITYNYMISPSNFFIPRLAFIPAIVFNDSYICISFCFAFFALGGAIRLFKTFYYYYPKYWREIALATLLLPDVCYWSAGLLKDPICFGAIGYITYGLLNIFIKKRKIAVSIFLVFLASYLLFYIKVYILLTLVLACVIWLFAEFNRVIADKTLRRIFAVMTFLVAVAIGFFMINYLTSQEAAQNFGLDRLMERSEQQRRTYGQQAEASEGGSYFTVNTSNPVLLVVNGISATFYRPFPWEIRSPIMALSAIEAFIFLYLTLYFIYRRGVIKFFKYSFSDPRLMMCFIFAFVFAVAVGSTTTNFGALSRYKIPCMPFYFLLIILLYKKAELPYSNWFSRLLVSVTGSKDKK